MFVIFDDVQFIKRGWQHRDKIKTPKGAEWLTLSVSHGDFHRKINETMLAPDIEWRNDCVNKVASAYKDAKYFSQFFPAIKELLLNRENSLVDYNLKFIDFFNQIFEIQTPTIKSSSLRAVGKSNELLINICEKLEATHYLTGTGSRDYLDESAFRAKGIEVNWQNFTHPVYPQLHGTFIPYLSVLDLVLNCGSASKNVIRA